MVTDPDLWIKDIHNPQAGESLGLHLKIKRQELLADEVAQQTGDDKAGLDVANSTPGDARTEYETVEILATLPGVAESEIVRRAKELAKNGRFHFVPGREFDSLREFLTEIIGDGDDSDGRKASLVSDATFLAEEIVPFMEQNGMKDTAAVVGRNGGLSSKIRAAIPQLRHAKEVAENSPQLSQMWMSTLRDVQDPNASEATIRAKNPEHGGRIQEVDILEFIAETGSLLVLRVDPKQRAWLHNRMGPKGLWKPASKWVLDPELGSLPDIIGGIRAGEIDAEKARKRLQARRDELDKALRHVQALVDG